MQQNETQQNETQQNQTQQRRAQMHRRFWWECLSDDPETREEQIQDFLDEHGHNLSNDQRVNLQYQANSLRPLVPFSVSNGAGERVGGNNVVVTSTSPTYVTLTVPRDAEPGVDSLSFRYRGQELEILVPRDAQAGDVLRVQVGEGAGDDDDVPESEEQGDGRDVNNTDNSSSGSTTVTLGHDDDDDDALATLKFSEVFPSNQSDGKKDGGDGTNAMVWPSGVILAQALVAGIDSFVKQVHVSSKECGGLGNASSSKENDPSDPKDCQSTQKQKMNCLELGSGLGVCGLALAHTLSRMKLDARILLTDRTEGAVKLLNENIQTNAAVFTMPTDDDTSNRVLVEAVSLAWGETLRSKEKFHIILGSDLLYNTQESYEPLLQTMCHHLHRDGRILLAVRWRKPDLERQFFEMAVAMGLEFVLWTDVLDTPQFQRRCPCRLGWKEYGDSECDAFRKYFCDTVVSVSDCNTSESPNKKSLAEITECDLEGMSEGEYTVFEESQIQIYVGKFVSEKVGSDGEMTAKKRSMKDISE